jgi:hypothetical protein
VGARYIFNITGGTIQGPKINGTLVAPSGDWGMPMPDGGYRLDVRASIKTNDGEFIFVEYNGVVVASKDALAKSRQIRRCVVVSLADRCRFGYRAESSIGNTGRASTRPSRQHGPQDRLLA